MINPKQHIAKPIKRSKLRQIVGAEYYIAKRKAKWLFSKEGKWAKIKLETNTPHIIKEHRSMILRPLQGVDMQLQENKRVNLNIAIQHLNEIVIQPGEVFSIWKNVGRPTQAKGYLNGLVLKQGTIDTGIGGGLCQLGNLLFWIFAHSPLTITERYRHGFDVFPDVNRKVPFGAGATLSYNHVDLQVKNETSYSFRIQLHLDKTHLNGKLLCSTQLDTRFSIEERNHQIIHQNWGGYSRHNQIVKIETSKTGEINEKIIVENHAVMMYNPFLEA